MTSKTDRIEAVYQFIQQCSDENKVMPTVREISVACDISRGTVHEYLSILEAQGRIHREPYQARNIRLVTHDLTDNESAQQVYAYLIRQLSNGYVPSQDEIAEACFLSRTKVRMALIWLDTEGKIQMGEGQRNIQLTGAN